MYEKPHHLVGDSRVIDARHALANGRLHQTRQRRKHIDRRIDLFVVQLLTMYNNNYLSINKDLAFCNVTCEIRNRVSNIIIGHG